MPTYSDMVRVFLSIAVSLGLLTLVLSVSQDALAANVNDDPTNFLPSASFTVKTNSGMGREAEGNIGTKFFFDARTSSDPEDSQLKYRWDLDGDTKYDTDWLLEPTITRVYWDTGVKTIKLLVRDEAGNFDHEVHDIKIVRNTEPTAYFTVEPERGSPAQEFKFNANESFDDQYKVSHLEYRWDFDGDKVYDTDWSPNEFIEHTYGYGYSGVYKVTMQTKDPENARAQFSREIEILENTVPVAIIDIEPKTGTFETIFRFNGEDSFDDETEFRDLKFRWDTDYNGPNDIIYDGNFQKGNYRKSLRYNDDRQKVGTQKVRMEVEDEDGKMGTAIAYVTLHWASPYLKLLNDEQIIFTKYDRFFSPDIPVPRGQVVQMILKKLDVNIFNIEYEPFFTDVAANNKYAKYIVEAKRLGIVNGYGDGTFKPDGYISRAETLAMLLRAFDIKILRNGYQFYPDVPRDQWFFSYVDTGTANGLVSGYDNSTFGPHDFITFGEIAKMLFQAGELKELN